ncbi:alpha/beta hydrolase [Microbacterium atlanticum]|uniref:alpha/beta hydrolase n=1 Tax=Microbacterium atlanticum TaxID=2782168 RepID=UPI00188821E5|nr:alpha/beta fold hydrolase [Microbacterium atlanticum]
MTTTTQTRYTRAHATDPTEPIVLQEQGSFAFGGRWIQRSDGGNVLVDAGYVQYQIPAGAKKHAIVLWHGYGETGRTWETTPDGREGYQNIWLRRGHPVFVIDQPRRGRASVSGPGTRIPAALDEDFYFTEQNIYEAFRLGIWTADGPQPNAGSAFPPGAESYRQYLSMTTPSNGPDGTEDGFSDEVRNLMADAVAELIDEIGDSILVLHSTAGAFGWRAAARSANVKGVIAYETSPFTFSAAAPPAALPYDGFETAWIDPDLIPDEEFDRLKDVAIQVVYGDYILEHAEYGTQRKRALQFIDALRARGGQAELLDLPERGITGNTHFVFSDLNNLAIADLMSEWLDAHGFSD